MSEKLCQLRLVEDKIQALYDISGDRPEELTEGNTLHHRTIEVVAVVTVHIWMALHGIRLDLPREFSGQQEPSFYSSFVLTVFNTANSWGKMAQNPDGI